VAVAVPVSWLKELLPITVAFREVMEGAAVEDVVRSEGGPQVAAEALE
jgi:hypothetical protein